MEAYCLKDPSGALILETISATEESAWYKAPFEAYMVEALKFSGYRCFKVSITEVIGMPVEFSKSFTKLVEAHADAAHDDRPTHKRKGWCTPYGVITFGEPVTYDHACAEAKAALSELGKS